MPSALVAATLLSALQTADRAPWCEADGAELLPEALLLQRVVACDGDAVIDDRWRDVVHAHCEILRPVIDDYALGYAYNAGGYLRALQPPDLPPHVLYPFGGADLVSALTVYPFATEVTTISLELVGDPRRLAPLTAAGVEKALAKLRPNLVALLNEEAFSRSVNLSALQRGALPGQLSFFLVALAAHGFEPVSLRYFSIEADGGIHYLATDEIEALEAKHARRLRVTWEDPDFSVAFANVELQFRDRADPAAPTRVHRHIASNLGDPSLKADSRLLSFLNRHGPYVGMTKAASYLLWMDSFSIIRDYLLGNVDYMVSESSGIPPRFANPAGFLQDPYGRFEQAYLAYPSPEITLEMRRLFASEPHVDLPFRFGYPDKNDHNHLLVTYRIRPDWVPSPQPVTAHAPAVVATPAHARHRSR
ncbi:MAG: hypothetical protein HY903_04760 [Deltaproteobacteria bacterium]|nr:hypothetical protein [Deltaproteobacteria bacterium]